MEIKRLGVSLTIVALVLGAAPPASAHGMIGPRFFAATLAIDDPFVADELSLPTISFMRFRGSGDSPAFRKTEISGEFSKRLSPNLGLSLGGNLTIPGPGPRQDRGGLQ